MEPPTPRMMTFGIAAAMIGPGVQWHHLHRLAVRGLIRFTRAGRFRLIAAKDLPAIREVCIERGYLQAEAQGEQGNG